MEPTEEVRGFGLRSLWIVMAKEFLDNVRNRWIVAISAIFIILTLAVSYFGAAQTQSTTGFQGLPETVTIMLGVEGPLVPILGLMLGYGAVVGEKEQGSIQLLLSMPVTRVEAILGKFLGLGAVMMIAVVSGLGVGGFVIVAFAGAEGWQNYIIFILGSMLFAMTFLSVGLLLSTVAKGRSTAVGLAVFIWFLFAVIFDLTLLGMYIATGGSFSLLPGEFELPEWFFIASMASPIDAFGMFTMRVFDLRGGFGYIYELPSFVTMSTTALSLILWTSIPLAVSVWRFQKHDL